MKIAIASGKGGTGKTMVCASLVHVWPRAVAAVDLDVEEPNLHLFLRPHIDGIEEVGMDVPIVDESKCTYCRKCAEICRFKAISVLGSVVLTYPEMCHGCGGCMAICPEKAITSGKRPLGEILWGKAGDSPFWMGRLRVGEAMSPPLMRMVKKRVAQTLAQESPNVRAVDVLIDAPPGVSCPAMNAVMDTDIIVLVTEPTPFGLYDLKLAYQAFGQLNVPMGVVINRSNIGNSDTVSFCREVGLEIWAEIPFERMIAEAYASGKIIAETVPAYVGLFRSLAETLRNVDERLKESQKEVSHA
ncbi:MAG: ATP-binding protein [Thermodesulfobacteriota bacterium]